MDFLWRAVSKKEQEEIKAEAKAIMSRFAKALEKVEQEKISEEGVQRKKQLREETKVSCDSKFRKSFFDNAPKKDEDWIKAERGKWK
jgi:Asp-tRNA(Asn)/Glu-tRNA(Gln) amidotransferase C subunit